MTLYTTFFFQINLIIKKKKLVPSESQFSIILFETKVLFKDKEIPATIFYIYCGEDPGPAEVVIVRTTRMLALSSVSYLKATPSRTDFPLPSHRR